MACSEQPRRYACRVVTAGGTVKQALVSLFHATARAWPLGPRRPGPRPPSGGAPVARAPCGGTRLAHATRLYQLWGPTDGCIALSNEDVEVVYDAVKVGTRVTIDP